MQTIYIQQFVEFKDARKCIDTVESKLMTLLAIFD